jgi:phosphate:Na+ symporter
MSKEIIGLNNTVEEFIKWNSSFISDNIKPMTNKDLDQSIKYENEIDEIRNKLIDSSRNRLSKGFNPKAELIFIDIIKHLEHIGDYSLNISQALKQIN